MKKKDRNLLPSLHPSHPFLDFSNNGRKDGKQFVRFLSERGCFLCGNNACLYKQFKPVICFVQFLQGGFKFVDDVGLL